MPRASSAQPPSPFCFVQYESEQQSIRAGQVLFAVTGRDKVCEEDFCIRKQGEAFCARHRTRHACTSMTKAIVDGQSNHHNNKLLLKKEGGKTSSNGHE
jgi:hypothetical protein